MRYLITNPDSFGDILLRQPLFSGLIDAGNEVAVFVRKAYSPIVRFLDPRISIFTMEDINPYVPSILEQKECVLGSLEAAAGFDPEVLVIAPFQRTMIDIWALEKFADRRSIGMQGLEVVYVDGVRQFRPTNNPGDLALFVPEDLRETEKNRRLLSLCLGRDIVDYHPRLKLGESTLELTKRVLTELSLAAGQYVVCTPGSSSIEIKQYPPERFTRILAYWAQTYQREILLVGNRFEARVLDTIRSGLSAKGVSAARWIGDEMNLEILIGLIAHSRTYFGNDTGPMHFAAALDKPVVALFGGGTWPRFIPMAPAGSAILQELTCYGCGWRCLFERAHCIQWVEEKWVRGAIDDLETGKNKTFTIQSHEFKGAVMDRWIAEAKEQLQKNKVNIDSMSTEVEKARSFAAEREKAATEGRAELEAMRTEYTHLKKREEEARAQRDASQAEVKELRQTNLLLAESLKREQEERRALDVRLTELGQQIENERETARSLRDKAAGLERVLETTRTAVDELGLEIARNEAALADGRAKISRLEASVHTQKERIAHLESTASNFERRFNKADSVRIEAGKVLKDFKPRLEELHLSLRQQDVTLQKFERALHGVGQSGWTKLGVTIGIPWLSRWHKDVFDSTGEGGTVVKKEEYENPLSVKDHLLQDLTRIIDLLEISSE